MPGVRGLRREPRLSWRSARKPSSGRWRAWYVDSNSGERIQRLVSFTSKTDALLWLDKKCTDPERGIATNEVAARQRPASCGPVTTFRSRLACAGDLVAAWAC